jgi:hypothetical protein
MRQDSSIVPAAEHDVYLVLEDFGDDLGRAWAETAEERTDRATLLRELMTGRAMHQRRSPRNCASALRLARRGAGLPGGLSGPLRRPSHRPAAAAGGLSSDHRDMARSLVFF